MNERHPHALVSINAVIPIKEQAHNAHSVHVPRNSLRVLNIFTDPTYKIISKFNQKCKILQLPGEFKIT